MTNEPPELLDRGKLLERLQAAERTIEALKSRAAKNQNAASLSQFALQKALSNLETTIGQRTEELQASESRYRSLFEHSPSMGFTLSRQGTIRVANENAHQAFAGRVEQLQGLELAALFAPAHRPGVQDLVARGVGLAHRLELRDKRYVQLSLAPIPNSDALQAAMLDVSERERLQARLSHSERLATIGRLAAGVAHEINNPLGVMRLGLEQLRQQVEGRNDGLVQDLQSHCRRVAKIVTNLQNIAAPQPPKKRPAPIADLLANARRLAAHRMDKVRLWTDIFPADLQVLVDPEQLEQVFVNLLTNGARATRGRGRLEVSARQEGDWALIEVADDGPGIPEALLEHLFEPFAGGEFGLVNHGLGLSISWGLVQRNGGKLEAANDPAGGARFELRLPLATPTQGGTVPPREAPDIRYRILCVDDETSLLGLVVAMLNAMGHEAVGVGDGETALLELRKGEVDLVLTDIRLPGMSGTELSEAIQKKYPALKSKVILMSGMFHDLPDDQPYLQKPFGLDDLELLLATMAE